MASVPGKAILAVLLLVIPCYTLMAASSPEKPPSYKSKSVEELKALAKKGDAEAQYWLASRYVKGDGVPKDQKEGVRWFSLAAAQGHLYALWNLAACYTTGVGVLQNRKEGIRLFSEAANRGFAPAQSALGLIHENGSGVEINYEEALKWYRLAADQGLSVAQHRLGLMYIRGRGVPQNYEEGVKWIRLAAEQGHDGAATSLAVAYDQGKGAPQDYSEAVKWYRQAAERGYARAQFALGSKYAPVSGGIAQDLKEAFKWWSKAAEQDHAEAQFNLGVMYETGEGVEPDMTEAVRWYRRAARLGFDRAQFNLAVAYMNGAGISRDYQEAFKWHLRAAEQGFPGAQFNLGFMYLSRVPTNLVAAYKWLSLAAAQGKSNAEAVCKALKNGESIKQGERRIGPMTAEQISVAERQAAAFVPKKSPPQEGSSQNLITPEIDFGGDLRPRSTGTAFAVTDNGFLITNFHVIDDASSIKVRTQVGTLPAQLVKSDKINDLAILKVDTALHPLSITQSASVKLGQSVFTIGFPRIFLQGFSPKLAKGDISSLRGIRDDPHLFQISAPLQPGNSGGPLVDDCGNVIGVVVAKLSSAGTPGMAPELVNYAIKSDYALALLESIPRAAGKLKNANTAEPPPFVEVVSEVEQAVVMVLVY
jgi:TPR repeat protein